MVRAIPYVGSGNGGARLLKREFLRATGEFTRTAPDATGWCVVAGIGAGGTPASSSGNCGAGGGAAFASAGFEVLAGQSVVLTVPARPAARFAADGGDFVATRSSTTVVRAKGGKAAIGSTGGASGQASECVGDVKRSGGPGGTSGSTTAIAQGSVGVAGPPVPATGHSASIPSGGSPASDLTDAVSFALGGSPSTDSPGSLFEAGPGAGGTTYSSGDSVSLFRSYGGRGEGVIEFWTSNPNL
jgi:hypothetical protein